MKLEGGCHCGGIAVTFETSTDPTSLRVRACQCSFCRRHGSLTVSDPQGKACIVVRDAGAFEPYVFALNTAEFYACPRCGVYVAAVLRDEERLFATCNVRALGGDAFSQVPAAPVTYDAETAEDRRARRIARWTPAEVFLCKNMRSDQPPAADLIQRFVADVSTMLGGFDPAISVSADPDEMAAPNGAFLVVFEGDVPLACGGIKTHAPGVGEIKRMYVAQEARRRGIARVLLRALEQSAKRLGMTRVVLDTAAPLEAATTLYKKEGYVEVAPFNDNPYASLWFEKQLR